jgi:ribosomal protein S18 acetylase RimI-like enzyme
MEIQIRPAKIEDAPAIYEVQKLGWTDTYTNEEYGITLDDINLRFEGEDGSVRQQRIDKLTKTIQDGSESVFVAHNREEVVGFIRVMPDPATNRLKLGSLYVHPDWQNKGAGSKLLKKAMDMLPKGQDVYLHVVSYNDNAIRFYEKHGFVKTGKDSAGSVAALPSGISIPEIEMVMARDKKF